MSREGLCVGDGLFLHCPARAAFPEIVPEMAVPACFSFLVLNVKAWFNER